MRGVAFRSVGLSPKFDAGVQGVPPSVGHTGQLAQPERASAAPHCVPQARTAACMLLQVGRVHLYRHLAPHIGDSATDAKQKQAAGGSAVGNSGEIEPEPAGEGAGLPVRAGSRACLQVHGRRPAAWPSQQPAPCVRAACAIPAQAVCNPGCDFAGKSRQPCYSRLCNGVAAREELGH